MPPGGSVAVQWPGAFEALHVTIHGPAGHGCMGRAGRRAGRGWVAVPTASLVVPAGAAVAGAVFLAWKPGVVRSTLGSPRALAFTLVVGAIVLALGWVVPRLRGGPAVTATAQAIPAILAFEVAVLPAFHNVTADEAFPAAAPAVTSSHPTAAPAGAHVVARAALEGIDHRASGAVVLVATGNDVVVRFESLDVEPGPDYQVHLVPGAHRRSPDGGTHLGRLRANLGDLNYPVPQDIAVQRPVSVLVWCRAFSVPVASATLASD
jgi:hypothetical protein